MGEYKSLAERRKQAIERQKTKINENGLVRARSHASPLTATRSKLVRGVKGLKTLGLDGKLDKDKEFLDPTERKLLEKGYMPVFDPVNKKPMKTKDGLDFSDMKAFLTSPLPKGTKLQCCVMRNKTGLGGRIHPTFEMYLEEPNIFLLSGRKKGSSKTSNYTLVMDKTNFEKGDSYLGKLRSNFLGTEFVVYDKGAKGKEKKKKDDEEDSTGRNELGAISYESNFMGSKGPRQMIVALPALDTEEVPSEWSSSGKDSHILKAYRDNQTENLYILGNKSPKWNAQVRAYVLDFNNRVTKPSVKNFQLINAADQNTVILQFGRVGKESFSLDFRYPLSPLQAFAIALSSCDYKLVCE